MKLFYLQLQAQIINKSAYISTTLMMWDYKMMVSRWRSLMFTGEKAFLYGSITSLTGDIQH